MAKAEERKRRSLFQKWSRNLDVPANRMISHVSWYLLFVGWILLAQVNMIDVVTQAQIGADVSDYLAFVWAFGFTISDIQMVYQLSQVSELQVFTFEISCTWPSLKLSSFKIFHFRV